MRSASRSAAMRSEVVASSREMERRAVVEQDRILDHALGEHALGQAGHEHQVEVEAARVVDGGHVHLARAHAGRTLDQIAEPRGQHVAHLAQPHRPDRRHRLQLGQHLEHAVRVAQGAHRDLRQALEPLAPGGLDRQAGQQREQRQGEGAQRGQVAQVALDAPGGRVIRILEGGAARGQLPGQAG